MFCGDKMRTCTLMWKFMGIVVFNIKKKICFHWQKQNFYIILLCLMLLISFIKVYPSLICFISKLDSMKYLLYKTKRKLFN